MSWPSIGYVVKHALLVATATIQAMPDNTLLVKRHVEDSIGKHVHGYDVLLHLNAAAPSENLSAESSQRRPKRGK